jgi:hypothetical protein
VLDSLLTRNACTPVDTYTNHEKKISPIDLKKIELLHSLSSNSGSHPMAANEAESMPRLENIQQIALMKMIASDHSERRYGHELLDACRGLRNDDKSNCSISSQARQLADENNKRLEELKWSFQLYRERDRNC